MSQAEIDPVGAGAAHTATQSATQSATQTEILVEARAVTRDFRGGGGVVHAVRAVSLAVRPGELVALRGRSGSGKTTLLNLLCGLDQPTAGQVYFEGRDLSRLGEAARAHLRRERIGMMFQNAHLVPLLTAQENVEIPLRLAGADPTRRTTAASQAIAAVGLAPRAHHRGMELSGGEQQRVALARALAHQPRFVVADEPTGNLDTMTGRSIIEMLREIAHSQQIAFLIATHDANVVASADRVLALSDGALVAG